MHGDREWWRYCGAPLVRGAEEPSGNNKDPRNAILWVAREFYSDRDLFKCLPIQTQPPFSIPLLSNNSSSVEKFGKNTS